MLTCFDVAEYFLAQADKDAGDLMSNLMLQKLVYYAQGFHLALFDEPLFQEKIEAWAYGPVVPELYNEYTKYGSNPIPIPSNIDYSKYDAETSDLLDEVYQVYGQFSAWKLRSMTLEEDPWKYTYDSDDKVISDSVMTEYFQTQLSDEEE